MEKTLTDVERDERDETVEALLHPDRSHHDELGRTEDLSPSGTTLHHPRSSPREQGAAPIDMAKVDE